MSRYRIPLVQGIGSIELDYGTFIYKVCKASVGHTDKDHLTFTNIN